MRVVAIVQARFGSTRLPGKAIRVMQGQPMVLHALRRAAAAGFDDVWLATSENGPDDAVASVAREAGFNVHRGSEHDVLGRVHEAAILSKADIVVRVTGDCPLWAPDVGRLVLEQHAKNPDGITTNDTTRSGYPDGLDTEVFSAALLAEANLAVDQYANRMSEGDLGRNYKDDREHVTKWMRRNAMHVVVWNHEDWREIKLSVDDRENFEFVAHVMANTGGRYEWPHTRDAVSKILQGRGR